MEDKYKITFFSTLIPILIELDNKDKIQVFVDFLNQRVYIDNDNYTEDDKKIIEMNVLEKMSTNHSFKSPKIDDAIKQKISEIRTGKFNEYK